MIEIFRVNTRKYDRHLNVYLDEENEVIYNLYSPNYRDYTPVTLPITKLDCKTLYHQLQKVLDNILELTTPTLLCQILKVIFIPKKSLLHLPIINLNTMKFYLPRSTLSTEKGICPRIIWIMMICDILI